ncbi:MAG: LPS biosynthesis protein WbpP [Bacteroidetes bacterium CG2_30_33_31]|nr:MAG: LPS biosynthesis protein WbpP [Bacteroidetes bacterium CG2_30_33_31]
MSKILITGGAGFIGSNLVDYFLEKNHTIVCLDNLSTGFEHNIKQHFNNPNFTFIKSDIRDLEACKNAVAGCDYVLHEAALGSVPRSIEDPATTNEVNIGGFLNMIIAARDAKVKRFVYAASSSTYGDSKKLPKVENEIGKPLSPYAITKYVDELYADVFSKTYGMQCIGLRYFNVFGRRQTPDGAYAAVIPLWVKELINHRSPKINGDGSYSRDFTFIENVIQANELALFATEKQISQGQKVYSKLIGKEDLYTPNSTFFSEVFNVAFGGNTNLIQLFEALRDNLARFDNKIKKIEAVFGPFRAGDIPHSQASIKKAEIILKYKPKFDAREGFEKVAEWYYENLK